jgi:copper chaperone CopZ
MKRAILSVPKMWADHHVLEVREVLIALRGVEDIYASSAWKQLIVSYDPDKLDEPTIAGALSEAGYGAGETLELEGEAPSTGDPNWKELGVRVTKTNQRDLELSGDFRRY